MEACLGQQVHVLGPVLGHGAKLPSEKYSTLLHVLGYAVSDQLAQAFTCPRVRTTLSRSRCSYHGVISKILLAWKSGETLLVL